MAPVSTTLRTSPGLCDGPLVPVPLYHIQGQSDTIVPWDGDGLYYPPIMDGLNLWALSNGCIDLLTLFGPHEFSGHAFVDCAAPVQWSEIRWMGHEWRSDEFDTTAAIWQFFAGHQ